MGAGVGAGVGAAGVVSENVELRRALEEVRKEKAQAINMLKQSEIWIENLTGRVGALEGACKRAQQERDRALGERDRLQELLYADRRKYLDHIEDLEAGYRDLEDELARLAHDLHAADPSFQPPPHHRPHPRAPSLPLPDPS